MVLILKIKYRIWCIVYPRLNCPKLRGQVLEDSAIVDNSVEDSVGNPGGHENGGKIESADHSGSVDWMMAQVKFANFQQKIKAKCILILWRGLPSSLS